MSIDSSVSDADAAANPIDVDKEQPAESQAATPSTSGGPAGANTNQEELSMSFLFLTYFLLVIQFLILLSFFPNLKMITGQAQQIARTAVSTSYASYNTPELSDQLDKNGRRMIAYPCKL
jgi:hypothetical protein